MKNSKKDYSNVIKEINLKLNEAAHSLKEASKIAKKNGLPFITMPMYPEDYEIDDDQMDEYDDILLKIKDSKLFEALDECGWSSSSMRC